MTLLPYNGWSGLVRYGRLSHFTYARRNGLLKPATECLGCIWKFGGAPVSYHAEEYGPTPEDHWASCQPLCNRCHAMVHSRFATPNRWKRYLNQVMEGTIDEYEYPQGKLVAGLLLKFKRRRDISFVAMPRKGCDYLRTLPLREYKGPPKVATLLVVDLNSGKRTEVPDWKLYGERLEQLTQDEREVLEHRRIDVAGFLSGRIKLPTGASGRRIYKRQLPCDARISAS